MTDDDDEDIEDGECPSCGSSLSDRQTYAADNQHPGNPPLPTNLLTCPHCRANKCIMCDMGDDVACLSCED